MRFKTKRRMQTNFPVTPFPPDFRIFSPTATDLSTGNHRRLSTDGGADLTVPRSLVKVLGGFGVAEFADRALNANLRIRLEVDVEYKTLRTIRWFQYKYCSLF